MPKPACRVSQQNFLVSEDEAEALIWWNAIRSLVFVVQTARRRWGSLATSWPRLYGPRNARTGLRYRALFKVSHNFATASSAGAGSLLSAVQISASTNRKPRSGRPRSDSNSRP
jgi:hypothetical protein